jgi:hypothetical protein
MRRLLRDVHHYLFDVGFTPQPGSTHRIQDEIRARMTRALKEGARRAGPGPYGRRTAQGSSAPST